jgi:hypothetical protein
MFCLLCPVLPLSLDYYFLNCSSVFTQCSVCCAQCCLCLLVISYWLAHRFSYNVLFVVPSVTCVSGLSFLDWPFGCHNVLSVMPSVACVSWFSVIDWPFGFHTMLVWKPKGQSITDNQETKATLGTTDRTLCENRRANQELITKRHRQHWAKQTEHCVKTEEPINNW